MKLPITLKNKVTTESLLLLIILLVAAVLRFWNFSELPFMHDELSALERTKYTNLQDEIYYGVALYDTHPAGVQLFLYYWIKVFGISEVAIKFPFILLGLLSIVIAYQITKRWFNSSVAIIVAAFMSVMQYMVMYSQIARPYVPGMFFSLLMVWCWTNYLFQQQGKKNKWLIGYIISSALCAYTHHFALLFAAIVGFTGLFFLNKQNWKKYLLAGILIFVLYTPHLQIFFFQFDKGGLGGPDGWLAKPESGWLLEYFQYLCHYSYSFYFLVFTLLLLSILFHASEIKQSQKFRIIAIFWFLTLFLIEYCYSVVVNPIIQYSTLIFSFPFLLIFTFSFLKKLNDIFLSIIVVAILAIGTYTLVFNRKHFEVFYKQPYQQQVGNAVANLDLIKNQKDATIQLILPKYYKDYYLKKYDRKFETAFLNLYEKDLDKKQFRTFVEAQKTNYFIAGNLPLEYIQIVKESYPCLVNKDQGFTYSTYCFSKDKSKGCSVEKKLFSTQFDKSKNKLDSTLEYSQAFTFELKKIISDRHNIINVSARLSLPDTSSNPILVMDIQDSGKTVEWRGVEYSQYNNNSSGLNTVYLPVHFSSFNFDKYPNAEVKIYIWNRDKKDLLIDDFRIDVTEGNHLIYSLYEKID